MQYKLESSRENRQPTPLCSSYPVKCNAIFVLDMHSVSGHGPLPWPTIFKTITLLYVLIKAPGIPISTAEFGKGDQHGSGVVGYSMTPKALGVVQIVIY